MSNFIMLAQIVAKIPKILKSQKISKQCGTQQKIRNLKILWKWSSGFFLGGGRFWKRTKGMTNDYNNSKMNRS